MRWRILLLLLTGVLSATGVAVVATSGGETGAGAATAPVAEAVAQPATAPTDEPAPAPAPTPEPEPTPEPTEATPAPLSVRLDEALAAFDLEGVRLGIAVVDEHGDLLYDREAATALLPASTQKLVVAAAALATFGPDHRYTTQVGATAAPGPDGVLHGDLVLLGGGDPALSSPAFSRRVLPERPATSLAALAEQVVASGVRTVRGDVVGDPSVLPHEPLAAGWPDRYLHSLDATRVSGLTVNAGRRITDKGGDLLGEAAADPAHEAARELMHLLVERGVAVEGHARAQRGTAPTVALGEVQSPPLGDLLRYMVQRSDNHLAEAIHRSVGLAAGDGTYTGAAAAALEALSVLELDWTGAVIADGSGLSREDRLSAALLATLDSSMTRSTAAEHWRDLMAVAGESGTLRRRLVGTMAVGKVRGKTGWLRDVRSLAGTVVGPEGRRLHVAVIGNDLDGVQQQLVREVTDRIVLTLLEHLHGCERVPVATEAPTAPAAAEEAAPTEPPTELVCAVAA